MWGDELRDYLAERARGVRTRTADQIQVVQQAAETALTTAKEQITSTLQSGQDAIRPSEDNSRVRPIAR
jgi:predicted DNA-binding protein (UPF0251 family)